MNRTPSENTKPIAIYNATPTAAAQSTVIDTREWDHGHVTLLFTTVAGSASDITTITVQESDASGSGYANITGAVFTDIDTDSDGATEIASIQLRGRKRYLRLNFTGGGSNDAPLLIYAILSGPRTTDACDATFLFEV